MLSAPQVAREQVKHAGPCILSRCLIVDVLTRIIKERVLAPLIDFHLTGHRALIEDCGYTLYVLALDPGILVAPEIKDGAGKLCEFRVVGDLSIKRRYRIYFIARAGQKQRIAAAHAKPDHSNLLAVNLLALAHPLHGALQISHAVALLKRHHKLRCFIRIGRNLVPKPRVQVGRHGEVALSSKPRRNILDMVIQSPPFLDHHDRWKRPALNRLRNPGLELAGRSGKTQHFLCDLNLDHILHPFCFLGIVPTAPLNYSTAVMGIKPTIPVRNLTLNHLSPTPVTITYFPR